MKWPQPNWPDFLEWFETQGEMQTPATPIPMDVRRWADGVTRKQAEEADLAIETWLRTLEWPHTSLEAGWLIHLRMAFGLYFLLEAMKAGLPVPDTDQRFQATLAGVLFRHWDEGCDEWIDEYCRSWPGIVRRRCGN